MQKTIMNGNSDKAQYFVGIAREKAIAGDHAIAMEYLKKAIVTEPQQADAYSLMGDCYDCIGQHEQAIRFYDQALGVDPHYADAWFNKGVSLRNLGREKESARCIEKSIEIYCGL